MFWEFKVSSRGVFFQPQTSTDSTVKMLTVARQDELEYPLAQHREYGLGENNECYIN